MKIITLNCNGIRAAGRKGFFEWMKKQRADVICLQETKAQESQLEDELFFPAGYHRYLHDAEKRGYSGVALYCRHKPRRVIHGLKDDLIDREGRYLEACYGNLSVVSLYMPSGSSGDERQEFKYRMMDLMMPHLLKLKKRKRQYIICGDWNIAHTKADIRNWRGNQKLSGHSIKRSTSTPGGQTEGRLSQIIPGGELTIRSPQTACVIWLKKRRYTVKNVFPIMHHYA